VDAAPIAIALLDPKGRVLLDNQAYKKLVTDLRVAEPAHTLLDGVLGTWRTQLSDDIATCVFENREARVDHRNGRPRWLSVTTSMIQIHSDCADNYFASSDQPGLLLVISDVTSLRAEQERARTAALQAAMAEEERTAALREGLSAAIFRLEEPMNVMASAVSILQRRDPSSADLLKHALSAGREHMESLRLVIPPSAPEMVFSVNLNEMLRDVLEVSTPRLLRAGVVVDTRPPRCRPCWAARCSCACSSRRWWTTPSRPWTSRAGSAAS
jgi:nitrogen fixation negative regulator NifL